MQRPITASVRLSVVLVSLVTGALAAACTPPPNTKMVAGKPDDGVAANSASEERLNADSKPKTTAATTEDPTQPLTTPLNGDGAGAGTAAAAGAGGGSTPAAGSGKGGGKGGGASKLPTAKEPKGAGGKVSKAECKQLFDKYIDLTLASDTRFDGIPPEMITQLKAQALSQAQSEKGDPCSTQDVSRTQYNCAISAPTTAAWQRCMK